jgi:hypothetical protein
MADMARTLASLLKPHRQAEHDELVTPDDLDDHRDRCVASGWQLRRGCTDGRGRGVCPACARLVRMHSRPLTSDQAWVVEQHRAA